MAKKNHLNFYRNAPDAELLDVEGKPVMEKWTLDEDKDVKWIMRENLKKTD